MQNTKPLMECVPNFSEGTDSIIIEQIKAAIQSVPGQKLLHTDPGPAANRTVFTFAGEPAAVAEAAFRAIEAAATLIDMRQQKGTHPRIGSTDVCPMIPLRHMSMEEAVYWADQLAQRVGTQLHIPVYLYEYAAKADYRRALPDIRKGQYEGLSSKMKESGWEPDYGRDAAEHPERTAYTGASIIGARNVLVAFNISLSTRDEKIAAQIARQMRSSSNGLLPALRAIGWYMEDFDCAQVSMNLLDYRITSPLGAWETCKKLAALYNVEPTGCEVVGLIPEACVAEAGKEISGNNLTDPDALIRAGIKYLKLDGVKPFDPDEKILEKVLRQKGLLD